MSAKTILERVAQNVGRNAPPPVKPEMIPPQKLSDTTPRSPQTKKSILADVNKLVVSNQSGKTGGS